VGYNVNKKGYFTLDDRKRWIKNVFADEPKIKVDHFEGLTIDYCKKAGAGYLLRGLRTSADFEYERAIAQVNKAMHEGIETVFFLTMPEHTPVTSTIVRDIIRNGGDASKFLPKGMNINEATKE
jgi:pantetheine-phosphate adenylyltransferase